MCRLATLVVMSDDDIDIDPIASTQMFRRFAANPEPARQRRPDPRVLLTLVALMLVLVLAGVLVWMAT